MQSLAAERELKAERSLPACCCRLAALDPEVHSEWVSCVVCSVGPDIIDVSGFPSTFGGQL